MDNRYDFVYLFDVTDGNPNGDPDAGNLPRVDPETNQGLVTDVCLKRKIRNFVQVAHPDTVGHSIYVREKAVLGHSHYAAFKSSGIALGEEGKIEVPENIADELQDFPMPDGMSLVEEDDKLMLVVAADADPKACKASIKDAKPTKNIKAFLETAIKGVKSRKPVQDEVEMGRKWMCQNFYDVRTFGAVMSLKSAPNCGQVRGPIQMTFSRSIDPIISSEHAITRCAVATDKEAEKQGGDNRTMGRKFTVPYGLYRCHGFINPMLAKQTGFGAADLELFWKALQNMFEFDHSASRGQMSPRGLVVFEHKDALGNAPAHLLQERVTVKRKDESKPARVFGDYEVKVDEAGLPAGVKVIRMI